MAANLKDLPRHYYTLEEYLALEKAGQSRHEYWNGDILCMSGGSRQHAEISGNVYFSLRRQLAGRNCKAFTSDQPVRTPSLPPYRYPDVSAACGEASFENIQGIDTLVNPILIVKVLSPGTESLDRNEKRAAYQALPSMREYLLIAQVTPHVTSYSRQGDLWVRADDSDLSASLILLSLNCVLRLSDIYEGISFN